MTDIHPTAIIGPGVELGAGVKIGAYCVLGGRPEHLTREGQPGNKIYVGPGTELREMVTVHHGIERDVEIGANCYLQRGSHIGHDVILGDRVVVGNNVALSGFVRAMDGVVFGLGVTVHQHKILGSYAMVGMGAVVVRDVTPGVKVAGCPARELGRNTVGLDRHDVTDARLRSETMAFFRLIRQRDALIC